MTSDHLTPKECGTVMDNVTLLEPSVYFGSLGLCLSFILVIFFRDLVRTHHKGAKKEKKNSRLNLWTSTVKRTLVEVKGLINGSGSSQLINLLYSVLLFYLITCFCSLYKTSQIIVQEPYLIRAFLSSDRSEGEQLVGFPLSVNYTHPNEFSRKMRLLFQSDILPKFMKWGMDST